MQTYRSVSISKLAIESSRLSYEGVLMAYHLNSFTPYLRIDRPELGCWQFLQPPPVEKESPHE